MSNEKERAKRRQQRVYVTIKPIEGKVLTTKPNHSEAVNAEIQKQVDKGMILSWADCPRNWLPVLETKHGKANEVEIAYAHSEAVPYYQEKAKSNMYLDVLQLERVIEAGMTSVFVLAIADKIKAYQLIKKFFSPTKTEIDNVDKFN